MYRCFSQDGHNNIPSEVLACYVLWGETVKAEYTHLPAARVVCDKRAEGNDVWPTEKITTQYT